MKNPRIQAVAALVFAAAAVFLPARAHAQTSPGFTPATAAGGGFGAPGQWVLTLGFDHGEYLALRSGNNWVISVQPSADYFLAPNISLGGVVGITHVNNGGTDFNIGARAGFNLNISGPWGFWPTAGIFINTHSQDHNTDTSASLRIFAPFLFHIVPHLFVGAGPSFNVALHNGENTF